MTLALDRLAAAARAVADAEPARVEATVVGLSGTRGYLAPLAWVAGTLVLVVRGAQLLLLNWRLTLIELVPATWVWLATWDLKRHGLRARPLQHLETAELLVGLAIAVALSIAAFWCNAVFGFAITHQPPRIGSALRQVRPFLGRITAIGFGMGLFVAAGLLLIPRIDSQWLYWAAVGGVYGVMLVALVVVPARIIGVSKQRLTRTQTIGRWVAGGALSAVAMTPGFVLDRLGVVMLGIPGLRLVGLLLLTLGAGLYAAGLSTVKAIKLSMKLDPAP
jgi:hypothetical protein